VFEELLKGYKFMGCEMSLRVSFIHFSVFPANLTYVSYEQGKPFVEEMSLMEERSQGKWSLRMLDGYC
jgi:hypothetical protein